MVALARHRSRPVTGAEGWRVRKSVWAVLTTPEPMHGDTRLIDLFPVLVIGFFAALVWPGPGGWAFVVWIGGTLTSMYLTKRFIRSTPRPARPREWHDLHVVGGLVLYDGNGKLYEVEHAGVWDPPEGCGRVTVFYEDEDVPKGAPSLYRIKVEKGPGRRINYRR